MGWLVTWGGGMQGRSQGAGGLEPLSQKASPHLEPPNEMTLSTGVFGKVPFWVPVKPPQPPPPCRPLILKSLTTPLVVCKLNPALRMDLMSYIMSVQCSYAGQHFDCIFCTWAHILPQPRTVYHFQPVWHKLRSCVISILKVGWKEARWNGVVVTIFSKQMP